MLKLEKGLSNAIKLFVMIALTDHNSVHIGVKAKDDDKNKVRKNICMPGC
jgi:hypothetical protein